MGLPEANSQLHGGRLSCADSSRDRSRHRTLEGRSPLADPAPGLPPARTGSLTHATDQVSCSVASRARTPLNHAFAISQSRLTVRTETLSTSATSASVSPP